MYNMYNKKFILIITILLIINSVITPVYAIDNSFASVFGGNGKEALAFMVVTSGLGITFVSSTDAVSVYNDLKENAPGLIADMVSIVEDTWLGSYSTVTQSLIDVKNSVNIFLQSLFETLNVGLNNSAGNFVHFDGYNVTYKLKNGIPYAVLNGIEFKLMNDDVINVKVNSILQPYYDRNNIITPFNITYTLNGQRRTGVFYGTFNISDVSKQDILESISLNISSDAGVLDGDFNPEDSEPIMAPPPFFPDINLKEINNPDGSISKYFDGPIDDYMGNVADNNTYSDVETYLKTGVPSTTLTDTGTGSLVVGDTNVDGLPFPEVGTTAPTDVLTGIGGITGLLQGITNWIANLLKALTNVFAVPTDLTLNFDSLRLIDFKNKFPFSIPWDLYNAIKSFAKSPTTPNLAIDLDTQYFSIYQPIDLSSISFPLAFARYTSVIFFIIFLISKTRDLIKW